MTIKRGLIEVKCQLIWVVNIFWRTEEEQFDLPRGSFAIRPQIFVDFPGPLDGRLVALGADGATHRRRLAKFGLPLLFASNTCWSRGTTPLGVRRTPLLQGSEGDARDAGGAAVGGTVREGGGCTLARRTPRPMSNLRKSGGVIYKIRQ